MRAARAFRRIVAALGVVLALAACGGPGSPREAWEEIRAALAAGDGARLYALHDPEARSFHRQRVREWRALVERGDDPKAVLAGVPITLEELERGSEADVVALLLLRGSTLGREAKWYLDAAVVEERADGPDAARLTLRGADGTERSLWFVRGAGGWTHDQWRSQRRF